jgi:hypothetical protein
MTVLNSTVAAAEQDTAVLTRQLELFESIRITPDTSVAELKDRFPHLAREIEKEIDNSQWIKDTPL